MTLGEALAFLLLLLLKWWLEFLSYLLVLEVGMAVFPFPGRLWLGSKELLYAIVA